MSQPHRPAVFDGSRAEHVALFDELPLWSALAGQLLLEHVPLHARRVLDVGTGTGFPLFEIVERLAPGAHGVGIDPWRTALERAHAKHTRWPVDAASLVQGSASVLPFRNGAFDLIVSNLGVNNLADRTTAYAECYRVLAPGGTLALSSNLVGHFAAFYEVLEEVLTRHADAAALERLREHIAHRATVAGLRAELETAGFTVRAVHERTVPWRFGSGHALLTHHFMRLGFVDAWREVAGDPAGDRLAQVADALDRAHGPAGFTLDVPLAVILASR
jgi:ubiquinone/menaquinone biosynthesis C-methylase UbiE